MEKFHYLKGCSEGEARINRTNQDHQAELSSSLGFAVEVLQQGQTVEAETGAGIV